MTTMTAFLAHSTKDAALVRRVARASRRSGFTPYLHENDPRPGEPLHAKLQDAISSSDVVIALLTREGTESAYVHQEVSWALKADKRVIPLLAPGVPAEALGMLQGTEHIPLDPTNPTAGIRTLGRALRRYQRQAAWPCLLTLIAVWAGWKWWLRTRSAVSVQSKGVTASHTRSTTAPIAARDV
jgi:hypothetical protein